MSVFMHQALDPSNVTGLIWQPRIVRRRGGAGNSESAPHASHLAPPPQFVCCNTNFHVEHHDFPNVPILAVPKLRRIAPEFYSEQCVSSGGGIWSTLVEAFRSPSWYSCMGVSGDGERLAEH